LSFNICSPYRAPTVHGLLTLLCACSKFKFDGFMTLINSCLRSNKCSKKKVIFLGTSAAPPFWHILCWLPVAIGVIKTPCRINRAYSFWVLVPSVSSSLFGNFLLSLLACCYRNMHSMNHSEPPGSSSFLNPAPWSRQAVVQVVQGVANSHGGQEVTVTQKDICSSSGGSAEPKGPGLVREIHFGNRTSRNQA